MEGGSLGKRGDIFNNKDKFNKVNPSSHKVYVSEQAFIELCSNLLSIYTCVIGCV